MCQSYSKPKVGRFFFETQCIINYTKYHRQHLWMFTKITCHLEWMFNLQTTATILQPLYRSTWISQHSQLRTGGQQWTHLDSGQDTVLNGVTYTISISTIIQVNLCYLTDPVNNWRILLDQSLLSVCPCSWQPSHWGNGEDARVLNGVTYWYTVSVPQ